MLLNALSQSDDVYGMYQPIKSDMYHEKSISPYRVLYGKHPAQTESVLSKKIIFIKETIGHKYEIYCKLEICEENYQFQVFRTIFLFREPVANWLSWKANKLAWPHDPERSLRLFIMAYKHAYATYKNTQVLPNKTYALAMENLRDNPKQILPKICDLWEITFIPSMVANWRYPLFKNPNLYYHPKELEHDSKHEITTQVHNSKCVHSNNFDNNREHLLTEREKYIIHSELFAKYEEIRSENCFGA